MKLARIGELTVRLAGGPDGAGGGDGPLVVLLHGFGAPGDDLVALGELLALPPAVRFAFPAAPLALQGFGGRAWWMIDLDAIQDAHARGVERDQREHDPERLPALRDQLGAVLDQLGRGAPVVLGGFSQGAMLACDVALRDRRALSGLILWSGSFLAAGAWRAGMAARAGLAVFQSHGRGDPLLPFSRAAELAEELGAAGLPVDFLPFAGGHEIPRDALTGASRLIRRTIG